MDKIEQILDKLDEKKESKKKQVDQFNDQATSFFGTVVLPALRETREALAKRGYECAVAEEVADDLHFRYQEIALEMHENNTLKAMLTFTPDEEKFEIVVALLLGKDKVKKHSYKIEELNKDKVVEEVARFLEVYFEM